MATARVMIVHNPAITGGLLSSEQRACGCVQPLFGAGSPGSSYPTTACHLVDECIPSCGSLVSTAAAHVSPCI